MIRSLWHKSVGTGKQTQGKVFSYGAVNNQTGLQAPEMRFIWISDVLKQRGVEKNLTK
jgi:hypothetical protein